MENRHIVYIIAVLLTVFVGICFIVRSLKTKPRTFKKLKSIGNTIPIPGYTQVRYRKKSKELLTQEERLKLESRYDPNYKATTKDKIFALGIFSFVISLFAIPVLIVLSKKYPICETLGMILFAVCGSIFVAYLIFSVISLVFYMADDIHITYKKKKASSSCEKMKNKELILLYSICCVGFLMAINEFNFGGYDHEGGYMLLRLVVSAVCVYSAVKIEQIGFKWCFGVVAVLYNPVLPVHLGEKDLWGIVNTITAVFMWVAFIVQNWDFLKKIAFNQKYKN